MRCGLASMTHESRTQAPAARWFHLCWPLCCEQMRQGAPSLHCKVWATKLIAPGWPPSGTHTIPSGMLWLIAAASYTWRVGLDEPIVARGPLVKAAFITAAQPCTDNIHHIISASPRTTFTTSTTSRPYSSYIPSSNLSLLVACRPLSLSSQ